MNARTRLGPLCTLACGACAVAVAAVWGPYAQLLRVADDGSGSGLRLVVAELTAPLTKSQKTSAPALKPALNTEGEAPAAPRATRPALDTPGHAPHCDGGVFALASTCAQVQVLDTGPPPSLVAGAHRLPVCAPDRLHSARGPPAA
ncbi:MAG: hypothetical protein HY291_02455 [Planctomycetes bacterium]|nr:hypothetical protein [Planctomycetota bacterium]